MSRKRAADNKRMPDKDSDDTPGLVNELRPSGLRRGAASNFKIIFLILIIFSGLWFFWRKSPSSGRANNFYFY
ncbi:hypothetical protein DSO57_1015697 [Entomophthora muscae]|uniref:Uncharacterized protein n=1 Tax=Entomophthora muscae TaxID=34485 RepID=A0ACC2S727_9FUNG|nr:hypothetical protein DSO57_1015697 [Entomophthora muscae]